MQILISLGHPNLTKKSLYKKIEAAAVEICRTHFHPGFQRAAPPEWNRKGVVPKPSPMLQKMLHSLLAIGASSVGSCCNVIDAWQPQRSEVNAHKGCLRPSCGSHRRMTSLFFKLVHQKKLQQSSTKNLLQGTRRPKPCN